MEWFYGCNSAIIKYSQENLRILKGDFYEYNNKSDEGSGQRKRP